MKDAMNLKVEGLGIVDTIKYTDGRVEVIERDHNLVVNGILPLILSLLRRDSQYAGIQYWAVGSGSSSWDTTMPNPTLTDTVLTSELGRKAVATTDMYFVDVNYNKIETLSNTLEVCVTFDTTECNGVWREFALFGGKATATLNSGTMLNKKHHAVLTKTSEMVVERKIRLTISF